MFLKSAVRDVGNFSELLLNGVKSTGPSFSVMWVRILLG